MMDHAQRSRDGSICDVPGIRVGHATDEIGVTGCTVVMCEGGALGGVDVRGAAPGTRETDLLRPECAVDRVQVIALCGGSAFGLDAATGVVAYLEGRGSSIEVGAGVVPIVPAAVIFDLGIGDGRARPDAAMGFAACVAASTSPPSEGSVGAGTGATFAKRRSPRAPLKGGVGTASTRVGEVTVGALVVLNAVGEVVDNAGRILGLVDTAGETGVDPAGPLSTEGGRPPIETNTTIGVVATDLPLDKAGATRLAQAAHDGLARAVRPAHTAFDGDTFFALSTAPDHGRTWPVPAEITAAASDVVATAIRRAALLAHGLGGVRGLADEPGVDPGTPNDRS